MRQRNPIRGTVIASALITIGCLVPSGLAPAETVKHQVTGLFMKEREKDFRDVVEQIPQIKLVSIDFDNAEAVFEYDAAKAFPGAKPAQVIERLDNLLKHASRHTASSNASVWIALFVHIGLSASVFFIIRPAQR